VLVSFSHLMASHIVPSRASIVSIDSVLPNTPECFLSTAAAEVKETATAVAGAEKAKQEPYAKVAHAEAKKEQVAADRQRVADKAAARGTAKASSAATTTTTSLRSQTWSPGSSWFLSKIAAAQEATTAEVAMAEAAPTTRTATPVPKDESSPSLKSISPHRSDAPANPPGKGSVSSSWERSPLRNAEGSNSPTQRPPITNSASRGPASSLSTTSATATAWSTSNMSSASLLSRELNLGKEKQEAVRAAESLVNVAVSPLEVEACESRTPASAYQGADDSFLLHEKYFFKDGNVTFLVRSHTVFYRHVYT
jgi:hypothetical protein